ncbi:MAG: fumarate hydratase [Candidatus Omnitrophica bacterium]|nr:fumarate hydratase [Candidatus Omnitrophota bacterium]
MRIIKAEKIKNAVAQLCLKANFSLRPDVLSALKSARAGEKNKRAKSILAAIIENARIAKKERLAICQDTGLPTVFLEVGQDVLIRGELKSAINKGIEEGYKRGYLRNSIVPDPLLRFGPGYSPVVIHTDIVKGKRIKITVLPKGFGCENKTQLKMFNPTANTEEIKRFVIETVKSAGPDACPPYIVGVGIGATADYAVLLAKKSLLKTIGHRPSTIDPLTAKLLKEINKLNIGPMGLGGRATALAVNIEKYPTHIAGLPVAVSISCHALRSASVLL